MRRIDTSGSIEWFVRPSTANAGPDDTRARLERDDLGRQRLVAVTELVHHVGQRRGVHGAETCAQVVGSCAVMSRTRAPVPQSTASVAPVIAEACVAEQERDDIADLARLGHAPERDVREHALERRSRIVLEAEPLPHEVRLRVAGRDRVDAHAGRRVVERERAGEPFETGLRGRVGKKPRSVSRAWIELMLTIAPRRSISPGSVAFASIHAALRSTAKTESQSSSVIATASKYALMPALLTRPSRPPSASCRVGDGALDLLERPHVAREEVRRPALRKLRGGVGARRIDVEQRDGTALVDDRLGDRRADSACCARDENGLAGEHAHANVSARSRSSQNGGK